MERKYLKDELKLDDDVIDKIMKANGEDIERTKSKVSASDDEVTDLKSQLDDRDKQLKSLQKNVGDNEDLQKQIEGLQDANKQATKDYEAKLAQTKLDNAVNLAMRDFGARDSKAVSPFLDKDTIKLDEDGKVIGLKEQMENIKADKDYLFASNEPVEPTKPINATATGNPSGGGDPKPDFSKMNYQQMLDYKKSDPDGFAAAKEEAEK